MRTLWVHTMPMLLAEAHETLAEVLLRAAPGFSVDEIKALPENKALFATRTELVLNEGDKIWVPDEAPAPEWLDIKVGQELKLVVAGRQFKMKLHYPNRKPIKSQPFQLITEGKTYDGTTGGDGLIDLVVPTKATHCVVTVNGYRQQFLLGQLAPITTKKGVQARLRTWVMRWVW